MKDVHVGKSHFILIFAILDEQDALVHMVSFILRSKFGLILWWRWLILTLGIVCVELKKSSWYNNISPLYLTIVIILAICIASALILTLIWAFYLQRRKFLSYWDYYFSSKNLNNSMFQNYLSNNTFTCVPLKFIYGGRL